MFKVISKSIKQQLYIIDIEHLTVCSEIPKIQYQT